MGVPSGVTAFILYCVESDRLLDISESDDSKGACKIRVHLQMVIEWYADHPPQGLSEARRGSECWEVFPILICFDAGLHGINVLYTRVQSSIDFTMYRYELLCT
jgi:hypothetical protein